MANSITLLRAVLLGACLCIAAALARDLGPTSEHALAQALLASGAGSSPEQDMPFEGEPGEGGGGLESVDTGADEADGFEDALLHPQLVRWDCVPACVRALSGYEERLRTRAEDRRREKPPRALHG